MISNGIPLIKYATPEPIPYIKVHRIEHNVPNNNPNTPFIIAHITGESFLRNIITNMNKTVHT